MFTKQYYETIAEILAFNRDNQAGALKNVDIIDCVARDLVDYFEQDDPHFDPERFLEACGF